VVHCPICGEAASATGEGGEITACPHLAFIYVREASEFAFQSDDFQKRIAAVDVDDFRKRIADADEDDDEFPLEPCVELLEETGYDDEFLAIEITYGGMACGPIAFTDVYGFDYGTLAKTEES